jgi:citrate lyase beta subunit
MILCLITNDVDFALDAEAAGIDRIMVDLEVQGKAERQAGQGLFLSQHQPDDVCRLRARLRSAKVMVRVNPLHAGTGDEIDAVLGDGADVVMLPMFDAPWQVAEFIGLVRDRATTSLLLETKAAVGEIARIVEIRGIGEIHVGLNDLRISLGLPLAFDVVSSGLLDALSATVRGAGIPFGFGGIARLTAAHLPISPESILAEQVRLGASVGLLGRSFRETLERQRRPGELTEEVGFIRAAIDRWSRASPRQYARMREGLLREIAEWRQNLQVRVAAH